MRGIRLALTPKDLFMFHESTRPMPVVASTAHWRLPDNQSMTVLAITNGRSRIFIAPDDLEAIAGVLLGVLAKNQAVAS